MPHNDGDQISPGEEEETGEELALGEPAAHCDVTKLLGILVTMVIQHLITTTEISCLTLHLIRYFI